MKTGSNLDCLKLANVIPIYKKGSKLQVGYYRPIFLLFLKLYMKDVIIVSKNLIVFTNTNLVLERVILQTMLLLK